MIPIRAAFEAGSIFWPEFREIDGSVYLAREVPATGLSRGDKTRTEAESFHNHVHILDLVNHNIPGHESEADGSWIWDVDHPEFALATKIGRQLATSWLAKLTQDFPGRQFRAYVTRLDDPIVRFHEVHVDEHAWSSDSESASDVARGDMWIYQTPA